MPSKVYSKTYTLPKIQLNSPVQGQRVMYHQMKRRTKEEDEGEEEEEKQLRTRSTCSTSLSQRETGHVEQEWRSNRVPILEYLLLAPNICRWHVFMYKLVYNAG